ncbi:MAG TPA: bifunctional riboflavin kinase/FAD synthetase [Gemmatimonadales bacterium]|nr:bifunctional riboflavin kinase/FAD synthetase [Gemmatimonadales bacterium]
MTAGLPFPPAGSVVTVGSFDGVHTGHLAVLREISARARASGRVSVLVTFEPHPMEVVNPPAAPPLLTTAMERREILAQTELNYAAILRFDDRLRAMEPEQFVRTVLFERFAMRELVIGEDHGFGRGRQGDVGMLRRLGEELGFAVDVVPPVRDAAAGIISSSRIRTAVAHGNLELAARLLGRPVSISGVVMSGVQRGRSIGVPTINLPVPPRKVLPPDGVYAVRVEWPGGRTGGMMNQGPRPTVGDMTRTLEAHLFDFEGDLYGQWVKLEWVARLRDVQRFESLDALRQQLAKDRERALNALAVSR